MLKEIEEKLIIERYSPQTIDTYNRCLHLFCKYLEGEGKKLETSTEEDLRLYILHRLHGKFSVSYQNQFINAVKFYFEKVLKRARTFYHLQRPRKEFRLPKVLPIQEIEKLIGLTENIKHKTILSILYSGGLRIGECLSLKLHDIDSKRMLILVNLGKGAKDRVIPLSNNLLILLRSYYIGYRPKIFLFEGENGNSYTQQSVRAILKQACMRAGIKKRVTPHMLRHSYATHLLESGVDIRYIQEILGHNSIETTQIYTHVTTKELHKIKNPLDDMKIFG